MTAPMEILFEALSDRYVVERKIGAGGMATVFLAHDVRHDRKVALKVLQPELAAVMGGERFLTEIRTTANLQHPHILPLFDSGKEGGFLFYVMPFIGGDTLRDRLDREKQLPVEEAVSIAVKVAGALDAAHKQGIVHRDIKPANILLSNGEPLVADFGIALAVQSAGGGRLTETGLSLGTPYYMSPEQATADRDPDARSDVYSLACVLYEMLAGEPPFQGSTAQAVLGRILTQPAPNITEVRASVPGHVAAVLRKALEKLPADRLDTAATFAVALADPTKAALLVPSAAAEGSRAAPGVAASGPARLLPWVIAAAGVVIGAAGMLGPDPSPPQLVRFSLGETPYAGDFRRTMAISPDGREIVFIGRAEGGSQIFRRSLGSPEIVPLPGTGDASSPAISPNGRWVAFNSREGPVQRVSLDGGAPITLAEPERQPIGISWASNEKLVFGMLLYDAEHDGLSTVEIGDPTVRDLTLTGGGSDEGMHHEPFVLPGGTHALTLDFGEARMGLSVVSLDDGTTTPVDIVGPAIRGRTSIVGVHDGVLLYIGVAGNLHAVRWDERALKTVGEAITVPGVPPALIEADLAANGTLAMRFTAGSYRVAILDDRGGVIDVIADPWFDLRTPRFSPDGNRVLMAGGHTDAQDDEVWIYDLRTGILSQLGLGFEPSGLDWSPGGDRIIGVDPDYRLGATTSTFWSRASDASDDPVEHATMPGLVLAISMAPDGESTALAWDRAASFSLDRYDVRVGSLDDTTAVPIAATDAFEASPRFSPDGRWIAYTSNESSRPEVYLRPYPGPGGRVQISDQGGWQPVWAGDSRTLFYRRGGEVVRAELEVDDATGRATVPSRVRLFEGDFLGGATDRATTWDVHPDGDRFVLAQGVGGSTGRIVVWMNWFDEVRALLGR